MRLYSPLAAAVLTLALVACGQDGEPTPTPTPAATPTAIPTATAAPTPTPSPTPVPLSLEPAAETSEIVIDFRLSPNIPAEGAGELIVTVTNQSDEPISEIVLRYPTALAEQLVLAPFEPSPERMVNPLVVPWTKWVEGPGVRGEPAGTTSIGYGPVDPGVALDIPLVATRVAGGPIEFDLQFLDREAILQTPDGEPAQTRVQIAAP